MKGTRLGASDKTMISFIALGLFRVPHMPARRSAPRANTLDEEGEVVLLVHVVESVVEVIAIGVITTTADEDFHRGLRC